MTVQAIVFPDASKLIADHLRSVLVTVPVGTKIPNPRPATFVLVRRLGGVRRNLVTDEPLIGLECWAADDAAAQNLAQLARAHMGALVGVVLAGTTVYRVDEVSGPQDLPDPLAVVPRYVQQFTVALRGTPI